jgi:hypothetical protein
MRHLSKAGLLEVAEGLAVPDAVEHSTSCGRCRRQVEELRAAWALAREAEQPEPSPLFWEHFPRRVMRALEAEPETAGLNRAAGWLRGRMAAAVLLVATVAIGATLGYLRWSGVRQTADSVGLAAKPTLSRVDLGQPAESAAFSDDTSWDMLSHMAEGMDWETAQDAGLGLIPGWAETAASQLSDEEQHALVRLLRAEVERTNGRAREPGKDPGA